VDRIGYTIGELCELLAADDSETGEIVELTAGDIMHNQHVTSKICCWRWQGRYALATVRAFGMG
jgi:hypothetical protein